MISEGRCFTCDFCCGRGSFSYHSHFRVRIVAVGRLVEAVGGISRSASGRSRSTNGARPGRRRSPEQIWVPGRRTIGARRPAKSNRRQQGRAGGASTGSDQRPGPRARAPFASAADHQDRALGVAHHPRRVGADQIVLQLRPVRGHDDQVAVLGLAAAAVRISSIDRPVGRRWCWTLMPASAPAASDESPSAPLTRLVPPPAWLRSPRERRC